MRVTPSRALWLVLSISSAGCTKTAVGGGLIALGAASTYEGTGIALGGSAAYGKPMRATPEVGVPLLLTGLLTGGVGISLVAMGDSAPAKPPHRYPPRVEQEDSEQLRVDAPTRKSPWTGALPPPGPASAIGPGWTLSKSPPTEGTPEGSSTPDP